jgi:CheY-like chemotaxis protein
VTISISPGPTILVVLDDPDERELIRRMLGQLGWRIVFALTEDDALTVAADGGIDVLLTEVGPQLDGRRLSRTLGVRTLLISALVRHPELDALDGTVVVKKPFTRKSLVRAIGAALA